MLAKEALKEFKLDCEIRRLSIRTIKGYKNNNALFLNYCAKEFGIYEIEQVSHRNIKKYIQYLLKN